ncbi:MAG: hypothetical protein DRI34_03250 [Deltaproteobacteria bacterium]|nr:MAG: hypothetical protein DRI34_03250 [Deltaproteobacteria bacterium]
MSLATPIAECQAEVHGRWLDRVMASYPEQARPFFRRQKNRFANPVGQTLDRGLRLLLQELAGESRPEELCRHLEEILRVRSVQSFTPAQAVRFLFELKDIVREVLGERLADRREQEWLGRFDRQVDQLALFAFDIYSRLRERMYQLRIAEVKRSVSTIMKRTGYFSEELFAKPVPEQKTAGPSGAPGE